VSAASFLQVRLGARHIEIEERLDERTLADRWLALWGRRAAGGAACLRRCSQAVAGPAVLPTLLARLASGGEGLPRRARLCLGDDLIYTLLLDAEPGRLDSLAAARAEAQRSVAQTTGLDALQVEATLLPGGRAWLACAVEIAVLDAALDALAAQGIEVDEVAVALLDDLRALADRLPEDLGSVALLRPAGVTVLGFEAGRLVAVEWEPLAAADDAGVGSDGEALFARLLPYRRPATEWPLGAVGVPQFAGAQERRGGRSAWLAVERPGQRRALEAAARRAGWGLLPERLRDAKTWEVAA